VTEYVPICGMNTIRRCCGIFPSLAKSYRLQWRHSNLWSLYDLHVVGHDDVVLWEVNW